MQLARVDVTLAREAGLSIALLSVMIRRAPLAAIASLSAALLATACSAPALPADSSPTPAATTVPSAGADAGGVTPAVTFGGGDFDAGYVPPLGDGGVTPGVCAPQPVTAVAPAWIPPHALHRNVCTPQEAAAIVSCFVQNQNCQVLVSSACHQCAVSGDNTPYSSALIVHQTPGVAPELNIEGCVGAVSKDPSATGCGPKLAAKYACAASACAGCKDAAGFQTCSTQADTTSCATQSAAAQCAAPYLAQCVQGTTELEVAFNLVKTFCGP